MWIIRKSFATLPALFAAGLLSLLGPSDASAAPCVPAPLSAYIVLGSSGCTVTDKLFFDFAYTFNEGEDPVPAESIVVSPIPTPGNPGLRFTSAFWIEPPIGGVIGQFIEYTVQTQGALIEDTSLEMVAEASGDEALVQVLETKCLDGLLPVGDNEGCSSGNAVNLNVIARESSTSLSDSATFAPVSFLDVFMIIRVRAAPPFPPPSFGDAELFEVSQQFSQVTVGVPEPATFLLMGIALAGLFAQRRHSLTKTARPHRPARKAGA